jgi:RNA polymerase sigma-70 factor (ECF subfamily)
MTEPDDAFSVQSQVRRPWRDFLDRLAPLRPDLHRYCCRLTGNVWDGEDLVQDVLLRVFGQLGRLDANLENPRAYLMRVATHLWIDRMRRRERERALPIEEAAALPSPAQAAEVRGAMGTLIQHLAPRERAAVLLKDVFDLSLEETASVLQTSVGAVKAALHRGRGRLENADREVPAAGPAPSPDVVDRFVKAMTTKDIDGLRALCSPDVSIELVGGAEFDGFERGKSFFEHAHFVMPELGFGANPRWEAAVYGDEPVAIGFRTLDGFEGLNEVHRLEVVDGAVVRIRCYCFCPDTLRLVAEHLGIRAVHRPYRSPG